jgi:alcohol dehydrogenase, propanol-preferring
MPQTMKAAVVHQFGQPLTLEEVAIPEPGAGQVLMKVVASYRSRIDRRNASGFA